MKYEIIQSRELFCVFEDNNKLISYHYSLIDAEIYIKKLQYVYLMYLLKNDY